ncbi:MAG: chemotaxis protein CheX [Bdellovibrionales bacterium]
MANSQRISGRVLETINYVNFADETALADADLLASKLREWQSLAVEMHVFDLKGVRQAPDMFFRQVRDFVGRIGPARLISVHMTDELFTQVARLKLESTFNRVKSLQEIHTKKQLRPGEIHRLLVRGLIRAAYSAVELALHSTVSCDENYRLKPDQLPLRDFDLISMIDVRTDFTSVQIRFCASTEVLKKLAGAMLGGLTQVDQAMIESLAMELLNMIYGRAKAHLNDHESFQMPSALPRLVRREQFGQIRRSTSAQDISVLPLVTPMGSFYMEVDFGAFAQPARPAV